MSCCAPGVDEPLDQGLQALPSDEEVRLASRVIGDGLRQADLSVPGVHCAACIGSVEKGLGALDGVERARVNLSTKRVSVTWRGETPPPMIDALARLGYAAHLFEPGEEGRDQTLAELVRALAVSGFAAGNIMLLSVSVWSGAEAATRDLFHWISALIAIPALIFAGRIYYRSAWQALRHGRMNMDVPIALGVSLAYAMSLYETIHSGPHAYFDASVTLLFFLLIGRTLDHVMRERARSAVRGLIRLAPRGATVLREDGAHEYVPVAEIQPGMRLRIMAGDRIPVDARVVEGASDIDRSLVSGESEPQPAVPGTALSAGTLNLTGPLVAEASAVAGDSFLAEMIRLMEAAEGGRARYRRIADRVSSLYSPVVHLTALLTFAGWMIVDGDWHRATTIAIAVLIITCPCALGLAVPIVQVVAARRLFDSGVMIKDGSALERLAEIDTVVFDKTGTLTMGLPRLAGRERIDTATLSLAAALARQSRHPVARAIAEAGAGLSGRETRFEAVREEPGFGIEGRADGALWRLGRAEWALAEAGEAVAARSSGAVLARDGVLVAMFEVEDRLRPGAAEAIADLRRQGMAVEMLTGDRQEPARDAAARLGVETVRAGVLPGEKAERLAALASEGHKALMVGDGLNDAPALAAAHVSMAPATAADVGRNAADFVFLRDALDVVPRALSVSRRAGRLIRENLAIALLYNAIAVPIAILGYVTPLIAAVAMSLSSVIVIANAMRLSAGPSRVRAPKAGREPRARMAAEAGR
jgi:Cu2+-exporting ATPase